MCTISINSYDWDSSESEGKRSKPTPLPHMRLWFLHGSQYLFTILMVLSAKPHRTVMKIIAKERPFINSSEFLWHVSGD